MSEAKKCDMCEDLYEPGKEDNHVTVQEAVHSYSHTKPKIEAYMRLFNARNHPDGAETIDHCQKCTEKAVLAFMHQFKIKAQYGEELVCYPRKVREHLFFDNQPGKPGTNESQLRIRAANARWFEQFIGKRVRITVEVL